MHREQGSFKEGSGKAQKRFEASVITNVQLNLAAMTGCEQDGDYST